MTRSRSTIFAPWSRALSCAVVAASLLLGSSASAQHEGITVSAVGEATVKPDVLVFEGTLMESAELAEDALVAFQDSRRRALASLERLEVEGLEVEPGAIRLSRGGQGGGGMGMMIGGIEPGEQVPPGQLAISQSVTIRVTGVDAMEADALVDLVLSVSSAVKEAGIGVGEMTAEDMLMMEMGMGGGGSGLATLRVSDPETAQQEAAASAIRQARAKAQRLADLAGVELGRVTAIVEGSAPADDQASPNNYIALIYGIANGESEGDGLSTSAIEPVTVRANLTVTFAIQDE